MPKRRSSRDQPVVDVGAPPAPRPQPADPRVAAAPNAPRAPEPVGVPAPQVVVGRQQVGLALLERPVVDLLPGVVAGRRPASVGGVGPSARGSGSARRAANTDAVEAVDRARRRARRSRRSRRRSWPAARRRRSAGAAARRGRAPARARSAAGWRSRASRRSWGTRRTGRSPGPACVTTSPAPVSTSISSTDSCGSPCGSSSTRCRAR